MNESPATQLPPELLLVIFSHLQNSQDEEEQAADQISLKSATLVCRAFTDPAQAILWQSGATLEGAGDLEKFIKSASRRRVGPKEITVKDGRDAIDEKLLIRLWDSIRGVERLTIISGETRVSAETFNHAALAGLKSLGLCVRLRPSKSTTSLPFELNKLNLIDTEILTPHQASFLSTIARSSSSSMRTLSLSSISGSAHLAVSRSILPFAPNLRHLGLSNESPHDPVHYVRFLESTTALRSLECTSLSLPLLHALPESLRGLATMEETRNLQVDQLKIAFERLKGLERLYFACSKKEFEGLEGGMELVKEMERREVEWHFAEDY